jgi:hypothetical protein
MIAIALPKVKPKVLFRWDGLRDALGKAGIETEKVSCYRQVNQLRCLNNAIKHAEFVGEELAATRWGKAKDVIDPGKCNRELSEYLENGEEFVKDVRAKLAALIPSSRIRAATTSNPGPRPANP